MVPVIFTLYTKVFRSSGPESELFKYSDDSALVDFLEKENVFEEEAERLRKWCERHFLEMNVRKNKRNYFTVVSMKYSHTGAFI